jgi:hypothetical protein
LYWFQFFLAHYVLIYQYNLPSSTFEVVKYQQYVSEMRRLNHKLQKIAMTFAITLFASVTVINSLSGITFVGAQEYGSNSTAGVFPPDSKPYGLTYGEWTSKWWQWAYMMPEASNPMVDNTGEKCANNQSGPVWFLAGTAGGAVTRECAIPSDIAILIPIINVLCDSALDRSLDTEAKLRECAKTDQDTVTGKEITVDGTNIANLDSYRFQSPVFNLTYPENNIAGVAPQTAKAVSDGFWVLLEPLSPGSHEIHFKATLGDPTAIGTANFALDVRYLLTVVGEQMQEGAPTENINNQSIPLQNSSTDG